MLNQKVNNSESKSHEHFKTSGFVLKHPVRQTFFITIIKCFDLIYLFLQKTNFMKQLDFFANIGLSPFLIHVVVRSGLLTSLSSFHSLSFYIPKEKTNISFTKPKKPTTKTPSCLSSPLICLYPGKKMLFPCFTR